MVTIGQILGKFCPFITWREILQSHKCFPYSSLCLQMTYKSLSIWAKYADTVEMMGKIKLFQWPDLNQSEFCWCFLLYTIMRFPTFFKTAFDEALNRPLIYPLIFSLQNSGLGFRTFQKSRKMPWPRFLVFVPCKWVLSNWSALSTLNFPSHCLDRLAASWDVTLRTKQSKTQ